ncbi:HlyD family secretion protein [Mesobacterium pallidum]|uniref:HlyD family secretion protein n=1 Tax=Mesobacterium pallidum TaxID=2872037 RepID=UPI001EE32AA0|nr:HlyD family efflux transporter periplasmic adaptor subunit [Mesobacterium pallidum]
MTLPALCRRLALLPLLGFGLGWTAAQAETIALGLLAQERIALTATASELVTELPVPEGTAVTAGTLLVQLDPGTRKAAVDVARAQLAIASAEVDRLTAGARAEEIAIAEAGVAAARAAATEAEATLQRDRQLLTSGTITEARLQATTAARDAAEAGLAGKIAALDELRAGARPEDRRIAEARRDAALASLAAEQRRLDDLQIRAPRDGVLDSLPWNLGERVTLGSPVAVMAAGNRPFARVYIPETARVGLATGTKVTLRVDGLDAQLTGSVRWISSEPAFTPYYGLDQAQRSRLVYLAEIALPEDAPDLPAGLPVEVVLP